MTGKPTEFTFHTLFPQLPWGYLGFYMFLGMDTFNNLRYTAIKIKAWPKWQASPRSLLSTHFFPQLPWGYRGFYMLTYTFGFWVWILFNTLRYTAKLQAMPTEFTFHTIFPQLPGQNYSQAHGLTFQTNFSLNCFQGGGRVCLVKIVQNICQELDLLFTSSSIFFVVENFRFFLTG